ncbi:HAD family hydrolase [Halomarina litorea]|uniref:HAD family hydrolase n=1 Tax=Halomarina litorea TaxID=2961595 RepID=UPI0020C4B5D0|nr:HAD family hydrolase [Halomarina sp. BCD28]
MTDYEGAFFDIGGVLLDLASVRAGYVTFLDRFAEREGIADSDALADDWRSALGAYFSGREGTEYRRALPGYQRAIEEATGREVAEAEWRPLFEEATAEHIRPVDGAVEVVEALDRAGVYLGVISDIDTWEAERMLGQFGIWERFHHVTTSEAVGRTKPDPAMFEAALSKAPVAPGDSLYVGDRYDHDMRGGKEAGLVTVAYGEEATDGPAENVDYVVEDFREILDIAGVRRE